MIFLKTKKSAQLKPANLFFIELIIVLLFFSFSAAVILQIFAAADHKQRISDLTEKAVICAQSVAETFSVKGDVSETVALVFDTAYSSDKAAEIILSDDFAVSQNGEITLFLEQTDNKTDAGVLSSLNMSFMFRDEELYSLDCTSYIPDEGGAVNG